MFRRGRDTNAGKQPPAATAHLAGAHVGRLVPRAWREGTLTRAKELESLCAWIRRNSTEPNADVLLEAVALHVSAAREAAEAPRRRYADQPLLERAMSNLGAAEALLLDVAPPAYLLGQLPSVLNDATRYLSPSDVRRRQLERVARHVGIGEPAAPLTPAPDGHRKTGLEDLLHYVDQQRLTIAVVSRAASSSSLREQLRVRSFRNVLLVSAGLLTVLAAVLAGVGFFRPTTIPVCFEPERGGQTVVVCPTEQSALLPTTDQAGPASPDVDDAVRATARRPDVLLVELVGLAAAAISAAAAIRNIRGSSEPHNVPVALALLKLPTGALTALLGLLLMRGQFIPGLTALDTSAQILAWALIFGYGQQLFTRLVDQQGHNVLDAVRAGKEPAPTTQ